MHSTQLNYSRGTWTIRPDLNSEIEIYIKARKSFFRKTSNQNRIASLVKKLDYLFEKSIDFINESDYASDINIESINISSIVVHRWSDFRVWFSRSQSKYPSICVQFKRMKPVDIFVDSYR